MSWINKNNQVRLSDDLDNTQFLRYTKVEHLLALIKSLKYGLILFHNKIFQTKKRMF